LTPVQKPLPPSAQPLLGPTVQLAVLVLSRPKEGRLDTRSGGWECCRAKNPARGAGGWHQAPGSTGLLGMSGNSHAPWVWLDDPPLGRPTPSHS
jgi:hypothetical protein